MSRLICIYLRYRIRDDHHMQVSESNVRRGKERRKDNQYGEILYQGEISRGVGVTVTRME